MINVYIDEFTPCLKDGKTGELVQTEVIRIRRKSFLKKYNKKNGWYVNWALLAEENEMAVIEFNRMHRGVQVEDLYHFTRKILEKHGWDLRLGMRLLETYDRILPLNAQERTYLYYLFLYPEKYWKQLNFYYNAGKAWIPVRSIEKLQKLEEQQTARNLFLEAIR